MGAEDTLLLNISSGTPAMKSALLVLKTLGEFPCKAIQVRTPTAAMNRHDGHREHETYEVETLWELDEDNEENFENRCSEVLCPTLSQIQQESHIRKLLSHYDYHAAYEIAQMLPPEMTANYIDLLQMASRRILLDFSGVDKVLLSDQRFALPIRDSGVRKYFEYALNLQIKLYRKEYADYIRAVTPLLWDLYERILTQHTDIVLKKYCTQRQNKSFVWSEEKLAGTKILDILNRNGYFHFQDVTSYHLNELIQEFVSQADVKNLVRDLREVEKNLRNMAAHQIVSVTEETIQKQTGFTGKQIMDRIRRAFIFAGIKVKEEYWQSYDAMNQVIISQMALGGLGTQTTFRE